MVAGGCVVTCGSQYTVDMKQFEPLIMRTMDLAEKARRQGDVPVGAIVARPSVPSAPSVLPVKSAESAEPVAPVLNRGSLVLACWPSSPALTALSQETDTPSGHLTEDTTWEILGAGYNCREVKPFDPSAHAEILALRQAAATLGRWRLDECTLFVNLEPCTMCAGAIVNARIRRLVFGAWDAKAGAAGSVRDVLRDSRLNHQVEVYGGVAKTECEAQLQAFFQTRRSRH